RLGSGVRAWSGRLIRNRFGCALNGRLRLCHGADHTPNRLMRKSRRLDSHCGRTILEPIKTPGLRGGQEAMGYMRTGLLLAAMTGLFLAAGFLIGGQQGMVIAFLIACAMNLFAYWNADKLVLRMYGAEPVDETTAPEFHRL